MEQVGRPPSTGLPATSCDNLDSYILNERGGIGGTDRAITTCRPSLNRGEGQCIHLSLHTQAPRLRTQKLPKSLWDSDPMDQQLKDLGTPEGTMNLDLHLALIPII